MTRTKTAPSSHLPARHRRSRLVDVLLPPAIFLAALTIRYSLVVASCREAIVRVPLEAVAPLALAALAFLLLRAWRTWRRLEVPIDDDVEPSTDRFMAGLALMTGGLSLIATFALWLPSAFIGPCGTDVA